MRKILLGVTIAAGAVFAMISSADAAGGCGPGFFRGPLGGCRAMGGPAVVVRGGPALGVFYPGRGYWDGRRYWGNRYRWHGGWRYR